jgi:FG-GAP repeat
MRRVVVLTLFLILLSPVVAQAYASTASSPDVVHVTLTSPNAQTDGYFGTVAVSGDIAVVGAHGENSSGIQDTGRAYVFNDLTGALISTLTSPNAQTQGDFGNSVAVSGNIVVVGAALETDNNVGFGEDGGHAYIFNAETGALISTLTSPNAQTFGYFGWSVAVSGDIAVVGAFGEAVSGNDFAGNAYTFNATTGSLIGTLTSPNAQIGGSFGYSVAISGKIVAVGAVGETADGFADAGHAYTFGATGKLISTLTSPNAQEFGSFGQSVAVSGKVVLVSALFEGRAYTFDAKTGELISTLTSPKDGRGFGWSVALSGDVAVVGAPFTTARGVAQDGRAYTFSASTGMLTSDLTSPSAQAYGNYGLSVSADDKTVAVGALGETADGFSGAGNAYIS